jgi:hypothetical protein
VWCAAHGRDRTNLRTANEGKSLPLIVSSVGRSARPPFFCLLSALPPFCSALVASRLHELTRMTQGERGRKSHTKICFGRFFSCVETVPPTKMFRFGFSRISHTQHHTRHARKSSGSIETLDPSKRLHPVEKDILKEGDNDEYSATVEKNGV